MTRRASLGALLGLAVTLLALGLVLSSGLSAGNAGSHPVPYQRAPGVAPNGSSAAPISLFVWTSRTSAGSVYLYAPNNVSGVLVYPTWHAEMTTPTATSYTIYVGGLEIASGTVPAGVSTAVFNVTAPSGGTATVLIGYGGTTYRFPNEIVATVSVSQYYQPPPPLAYTAQQLLDAVLSAQVQVYAVLVLAFVGSFFMARKIVILNAKSRARKVL